MKIICIGRNYRDHVKEMKSELPAEPVFFLKPDTALLRNHRPFYIPDFSEEVHYECELILKICKLGKAVNPAFAGLYYKEVGLGIDFTARDIQKKHMELGLPWEKAKSFDYSALVGDFIPLEQAGGKNISFRLDINGETRQRGNTADMIFNFDVLISYVSKFFTLRTGDLIFTGTPAGVGPVKENDLLEGYIGEQKIFSCRIR
jgi:acylpyruvate hydrolase